MLALDQSNFKVISSPANSSSNPGGPLIPEEEVVSILIGEDNQSASSHKQVRFSEQSFKEPRLAQKYRKQRSIPEKVTEEGPDAECSPFGKHEFRLKDAGMNKSTNLLTELNETILSQTIPQFNLNVSFNSQNPRTVNSFDQTEKINYLADELVSLVKNFITELSGNEKHFTFDETDQYTESKFTFQQKVLKRALEMLNFKLAVQTCSPISRFSVASPHFDECLQMKELQQQNEEMQEQNDLMKDKIEILDLRIMQFQEKEGLFQRTISLLEEQLQQSQAQQKQLEDRIQELQQQLQNFKSHHFHGGHQSDHETSLMKRVRTTSSFHMQPKNFPAPPVEGSALSTIQSQHSPLKHEGIHRVKVQLPDGYYFVGTMNNGQRHGYGILKKGDAEVYMGFWQNDQYSGFGQLKNTQGKELKQKLTGELDDWQSYQGEFKNGLFDGYGILILSGDRRFHGRFKNGKANGKGYDFVY